MGRRQGDWIRCATQSHGNPLPRLAAQFTSESRASRRAPGRSHTTLPACTVAPSRRPPAQVPVWSGRRSGAKANSHTDCWHHTPKAPMRPANRDAGARRPPFLSQMPRISRISRISRILISYLGIAAIPGSLGVTYRQRAADRDNCCSDVSMIVCRQKINSGFNYRSGFRGGILTETAFSITNATN